MLESECPHLLNLLADLYVIGKLARHITILTLSTAVSVFADVVCTLLPIVVVWNLTLSIKKKIAVCALMSLGVV